MALEGYRFRERKTTLPRHVIRYNSAHGGATYRNVTRDQDGNPELIVMPSRLFQLRLEYSSIMDEDEVIEIAEVQPFGATAGIVYEGTRIDISGKLNPKIHADCPGSIAVHVTTSKGLEMVEVISIRPHRSRGILANRHMSIPTSPRGRA
jgi:hypothetical protein